LEDHMNINKSLHLTVITTNKHETLKIV